MYLLTQPVAGDDFAERVSVGSVGEQVQRCLEIHPTVHVAVSDWFPKANVHQYNDINAFDFGHSLKVRLIITTALSIGFQDGNPFH